MTAKYISLHLTGLNGQISKCDRFAPSLLKFLTYSICKSRQKHNTLARTAHTAQKTLFLVHIRAQYTPAVILISQ